MLSVVAIWMVVATSPAATIVAVSSSFADVNTAVNTTAGRNDHVIVPNGSSTWSSTLNVTKGIWLDATGAVTITSSGGVVLIDFAPDATAISNEETQRLTGFTLDGANSSLVILALDGAGVSSAKPAKNFAIGRNTIKNGNPTTSNNGAIEVNGQARGCIYSNTFDRCDVVLKNLGNDDLTEWQNGHFPFNPGSSDNLYWEGNTVKFTSSGSWQDPGWMETGQGQRIVVRYSTWNLANATQQELWDIHGAQFFPGGQTGTMLNEHYGNSAINCGGFRWINHRGSIGVFLNNTVTGSGAMNINWDQYACEADTGLPSEEITNTYIANCTANGTQQAMQNGGVANCGIAADRNFWNYTPTWNGSSGVGTGTSLTGITPSKTGVGFYVASTTSVTTDPSVIQSSTLYKWNGSSWVAFWQPYTFPHPLSQESSGGGGTVLQAISLGSGTMRTGGAATMKIGQ